MEEERKRRVLRANVPARVHQCFISHASDNDPHALATNRHALSVIGYGTLPNSPREFSRGSPLEDIFEFSRTRNIFLAPLS